MSFLPQPLVILQGGPGVEAEVSRSSAASVAKALTELDQPYHLLELEGDWIAALQKMNPSFVFIALHGVPGEDGSVQGVLDLLGLPYNGSGLLSSALAMDKYQSKIMFLNNSLDVPFGILLEDGESPDWRVYPCVVKPVLGGSSVGVCILQEGHGADDLEAAIASARKVSDQVLVEEFIPGVELTVGVLDGDPCGIVEIVPQGAGFYDYGAKYDAAGSVHRYPAEIHDFVIQEAQDMACVAHKACGCTGATRVDFRYDELSRRLVILEVNTLPGLTPTSLLPEMAAAQGMDFASLVRWMIDDGLKRANKTGITTTHDASQTPPT